MCVMPRLLAAVLFYWTLLQGHYCDPLPQEGEVNPRKPVVKQEEWDAIFDKLETKDPLDHAVEFDDEGEIGTRSYSNSILWPKNDQNLVIIPYVPVEEDPDNDDDGEPSLALDNEVHEVMRGLIRQFDEKTCIRWQIWQGPSHQPYFVSVFGGVPPSSKSRSRTYSVLECISTRGYRAPKDAIQSSWVRNFMMLSKECAAGRVYRVAYIMMQVLGFQGEHFRPDRNCYLNIDGDESSFPIKQNFGDTSFPYDIRSVMQEMSPPLTSKDGCPLGPVADSLSEYDWMRVNHMYCGGPHAKEVDPFGYSKHQRKLADCKK